MLSDMLSILTRVSKAMPTSVKEYCEAVHMISGKQFDGLSLYACKNESKDKVLLTRFLEEDLSFIIEKAIAFWQGDLHTKVKDLTNKNDVILVFTKEEVIQMMSCLALGCFEGGIQNINLLMWQDKRRTDNFLLMEEYFHQMKSYPELDKPFVIRTKTHPNPDTIDSLITSEHLLSRLSYDLTTRLEDFDNHSHIDFANMNIGGGSLYGASAQEEVLFSIIPECCLSMAFCHTMNSLQAISIEGCTRVGTYSGYCGSFSYEGPYNAFNCSICHVIAIDAVCRDYDYQFSDTGLLRDINKATTGFSLTPESFDGVASGKWGCGVFGGNAYLKVLQQWISASLADRNIVLSLFRDQELEMFLRHVIEDESLKSVGDLMKRDILYVKNRQ